MLNLYWRGLKMGNRACPFCKDSKTEQFGNTKFFRCDGCGLFINIPMDEEQIKETNKNFLLSACKVEKNRIARIKEAHEVQCEAIERHVNVGAVYDVGAASGFFLKAARDRGWEIGGNEVSEKGIEWAKENYNMDLDYGFLEEINLPDNYYDAVVLWNTLEHTHNPYTTLEVCHRILKPGGVILIKVPNNHTANELNRHYESVHLFEFTHECLHGHLINMGFEGLEANFRDVCPNYGVVAATYLYRKN
jgi:SAM-dependent methyltransferase